MVDSLPPSGTDPDSKTIITNSNDELSVPLDGMNLDVGSSGKVEFFDSIGYVASFEDNDSGDWTGIDKISSVGRAVVFVDGISDLPQSASVTADLTDIDVLTFKIKVDRLKVYIKFDGIIEGSITPDGYGYQTIEMSGLDKHGSNTTVTIEAYEDWNGETGQLRLAYVRGIIEPESRKIELCDTGGLP
jgi:hypothetical protein